MKITSRNKNLAGELFILFLKTGREFSFICSKFSLLVDQLIEAQKSGQDLEAAQREVETYWRFVALAVIEVKKLQVRIDREIK